MAPNNEVRTITEAQWAEAKRTFEKNLSEHHGMAQDKYDNIVELLEKWEELTAQQRREMSGGNYVYWQKRYMVTEAQGVKDLLMLESDGSKKIVSHRARMFDDIKLLVHIECELPC